MVRSLRFHLPGPLRKEFLDAALIVNTIGFGHTRWVQCLANRAPDVQYLGHRSVHLKPA